MSAEIKPEGLSQAAAALVAHLRQHPEHIRRAPGELARDFGLSIEFVKNILDGLQPREREDVSRGTRRISFSFFTRAWMAWVTLFNRITDRPVLFVTVSSIVGVALLMLGTYLPEMKAVGAGEYKVQIDDGIGILIVLIIAGLHMACYFRHRMARYALYGGLVVWVITAVLVMIAIWLGEQGQPETRRFSSVLLGAVGMFFVGLFYAGAGSVAAVGGGWLEMKLREREQEGMSRQDLLERYFELQARLQSGGTSNLQMPWADIRYIQRFQAHPYLWSAAISATLSTLSVVLIGLFGFQSVGPVTGNAVQSTLMALFGATTAFATFASWIGIGFFSGRVGKALLCGLIFALSGIPPLLLPIGQYGIEYVLSPRMLFTFGFTLPVTLVVTGMAGLGAVVHQRSLREKSLQNNDQASIIAEMLRIQWRLADHVSNVCVLVVDAAKSSVMKAEADPLAVEYSFREYQEWLEEIGKSSGGRVHSTAGDGAVISFETCEDALIAAKQIQKDLPRFNNVQNRLKSPFRLRIGLHVGPIAGDIDEVQFTEVIDIAAHVQDVAPISGIAVTDDVAANLPTEQFLPLAVEVDGHKVFLVMEP